MSFIAASDTSATESVISNDGFFPDIDPNEVRKVMRMDGTVTPDRLRAALIEAMATANHDLMSWQIAQHDQGFNTLAAVPALEIDNTSVLVHRYQRAVYCLAKANTTERYADFDSTSAGNKKSEDMLSTVDDYLRDARNALNDIRQQLRTTIELI